MSGDLNEAAAIKRALWWKARYDIIIPDLSLCGLVVFACSANIYLVPTGRYNMRDLMVKRDPASILYTETCANDGDMQKEHLTRSK